MFLGKSDLSYKFILSQYNSPKIVKRKVLASFTPFQKYKRIREDSDTFSTTKPQKRSKNFRKNLYKHISMRNVNDTLAY